MQPRRDRGKMLDEMGVTFRFLATESEGDAVLSWFRGLSTPPRVHDAPHGALLHFANLGPLVGLPGQLDSAKSPVATVFLPRRRRGVLLTAGEVHFLPSPLRKAFPALHRISQDFHRWLRQFDCVFSQSSKLREWDYYLEGRLRNFDPDIFALPQAMAALRREQYFIADDDTETTVDKLCKALRLRGVEGILAEADDDAG